MHRAVHEPGTRRLEVLGLSILGGAALVLGAAHLTTATSVGDEVVYRSAAGEILDGQWTSNQQHPPLSKELIALARAALTPLGVPDLAADRLVGVVCFLLTGLLLASLGRRLPGRWTGVLAAALWWLLPLAPGVLVQHVTRYALLEGPVIVFSVGAGLAAVRVVERPTTVRWCIAGALVGLATASKLTGALSATAVLAATVLLVVGRPRRHVVIGLARAVLAGVVALLTFVVTYLPMGPTTARDALVTVVRFQLDHAADGHAVLIGDTVTSAPPWWVTWHYQAEYLGWTGVAALWSLSVVGAVATARRPTGAIVTATAAAVTTVLVVSSLNLPHYHALLVPLLCVLAAAGVAHLAPLRIGRVPWGAAAAVVAAVLLAGPALRGASTVLDLAPQDYRVAAGVLRAHGLQDGRVVVWGDARAAAGVLPMADIQTTVEPPCSTPAVIADATVVPRRAIDLDAWRERCGSAYESVRSRHVTVWTRR